MNAFILGAFTALGLGTLVVAHPCPLSTNVAAVTIICGWRKGHKEKLLISLFFVAGQILTYTALSALMSFGFLRLPVVADFLQVYSRQILGPFFIIVGMMISGLLFSRQKILGNLERHLEKNSGFGTMSGFFLGSIIALSFCPMSAAVFFGLLVPLAVAQESFFIYPVCFGLGTGAPTISIVFLITGGSLLIKQKFVMNKSLERKIRVFAGGILIIIGIYMSFRYIFLI